MGEVVIRQAIDQIVIQSGRTKKSVEFRAEDSRLMFGRIVQPRKIDQEDHLASVLASEYQGFLEGTDVLHNPRLAPVIWDQVSGGNNYADVIWIFEQLKFGMHSAGAVHWGKTKFDIGRHI